MALYRLGGKVIRCGATRGLPTSSWIRACALSGMSRGFPLIPLAVVDRRDRTGGRAHLSRAERLPPFVEEVAQRVGALNGRLDGDDAVRGVGVQPVEATAAGDEGALRGVLGLGAGDPDPGRDLAWRAVDEDGQVGM